MTQKRDCAGSRRSVHSYFFRVIAEHENRVLHLLLSRGTDEQERQVGRRLQERGLVDVCSHDVEYASPNAAGGFPQLPPTRSRFYSLRLRSMIGFRDGTSITALVVCAR